MIALHGIRKTFGSTVAVANVSFVARDGEVTGLLGPNGAGKTTLLRTLSGLLSPDEGQVLVDEVDVHRDWLAAKRRLGVLPESVGLYDRLTVRDHLLYAGRLHGRGERELRARVDDLLSRMDLIGMAGTRAAALSLGQRRRVALARMLVHDPANVVLDEPTNGLDVLGVRAVRAEIRGSQLRDARSFSPHMSCRRSVPSAIASSSWRKDASSPKEPPLRSSKVRASTIWRRPSSGRLALRKG